MDDAVVPRAVGLLAAAALVANRALSPGDPSPGQAVSEAVAALLAAAAIAVPSLEVALADAAPGRGRRAAARLPGAATLLKVDPALPPAAAAELGWVSYALLRNANVCSVAVLRRGREGRPAAALLRGAAPPALATAGDALVAASAAYEGALAASPALAAAAAGGGGALYLPDPAALARAGADAWGLLPPGAGCALVQPIPGVGAGAPPVGVLVAAGDAPRALTDRDRAWAASLAAKLAPVLVAGKG